MKIKRVLKKTFMSIIFIITISRKKFIGSFWFFIIVRERLMSWLSMKLMLFSISSVFLGVK